MLRLFPVLACESITVAASSSYIIAATVESYIVHNHSHSLIPIDNFSGSLSKGTEEHVHALINAGLVDQMLSIITNSSADIYLIEISLCVVRSIYEHSFAPSEIIHSKPSILPHMISEYRIQ